MSVVVAEKNLPISGHYESEVAVVKLPRCGNCGDPHPLAKDHWKISFADNEHCPSCHEPVQPPGEEQLASAYLNFPWPARLAMWIGRKLHALAKRIEP